MMTGRVNRREARRRYDELPSTPDMLSDAHIVVVSAAAAASPVGSPDEEDDAGDAAAIRDRLSRHDRRTAAAQSGFSKI